MRRVIFKMMMSLDGFFEGLDREDWNDVDEEFNEYASNLFEALDSMIMDKFMADESNNEKNSNTDELVAQELLNNVDWKKTKILKKPFPEILKLNSGQESDERNDVMPYDTSKTKSTEYDIIDEIRLIINPVALGKGRSLFDDINHKFDLQFIRTVIFKSGSIILQYRPENDTRGKGNWII